MKKYFLIFLFGIFAASVVILPVQAAETRRETTFDVPTTDELQELAGKPTNRISIPGLQYSDIKQVEEADGTYLYIPFLGEYIAILYRYLVIIAGLAAVIVIIVSGIQWTASAGNSSTIESAKHRITGALTGLGLAVGSYVILYTINPELVSFQSLKIKYVEGKELAGAHGDLEDFGLSDNDFKITGGNNLANCPEIAAGVKKYISYKPPKGEKNPLYQYTKDAELCRRKCAAAVPADKKSQPSGSGTDGNVNLGYTDCFSPQGTRTLGTITHIGIHEGRFPAGASWWWLKSLANPKEAFGTHYFIGRGGEVTQVSDERFIVYHGVNNTKAIGIDLHAGCSSGSGGDAVSKTCDYTPAQYNALKKLINEIVSRTNVKFNDEQILGHCQWSSPTKGHVDPRNFDWSKIGLDNAKHRSPRCKYAL